MDIGQHIKHKKKTPIKIEPEWDKKSISQYKIQNFFQQIVVSSQFNK